MKKKSLRFLFFIFFSVGSNFVFGQEVKKDAVTINPAPENSPRIKEHFTPPPLPVMINTGNPETDAAVYAVAKDKWIEDVLTLYKNRLSPEQANKLREMLKKENLDETLHGKILNPENELQEK